VANLQVLSSIKRLWAPFGGFVEDSWKQMVRSLLSRNFEIAQVQISGFNCILIFFCLPKLSAASISERRKRDKFGPSSAMFAQVCGP